MPRFEIYKARALAALDKSKMAGMSAMREEIESTFDFVKLLKLALQLESLAN